MKKRVRFEGWVVLGAGVWLRSVFLERTVFLLRSRTWVLLLLVVSQPVLVAQVGVGAGAVGVGGVSLGLQDRVWAVWNDPTQMLDSTQHAQTQNARKPSHHEVGFLIHQPYQLQSLQEPRLAYVLPYT